MDEQISLIAGYRVLEVHVQEWYSWIRWWMYFERSKEPPHSFP